MNQEATTGLLVGYDPQSFFCEMLGRPGESSSCADPVWEQIDRLGLDGLHARAQDTALGATLEDLRWRHKLASGASAIAELEDLRASLEGEAMEAVIGRGVHEYIDWIQLRLIAITDEFGRDFFGREADQVSGAAGAVAEA